MRRRWMLRRRRQWNGSRDAGEQSEKAGGDGGVREVVEDVRERRAGGVCGDEAAVLGGEVRRQDEEVEG